MTTNYNRRQFVQLSSIAIAGSAALISGLPFGCSGAESDVMVWDIPGGDFLRSPDYEVTLRKNGKKWKPFTMFSQWKHVEKIIDHEGEGKYIKLGFGEVQSSEYLPPEKNPDTYAHSWICFDFTEGPVEVEVRILRPIVGLTLPLQSCEVYPSTLGIKCQIEENNVIRFVMDKPAKIAIVPNSLLALEKLADVEPKSAFEGYRNPLFLFARSPESDIPSKKAEGTLIVKPGEKYSPAEFNEAKTIFFEPGIHDYSKYNPDDPNHYINLKKGQTVYLSGGAFLYGVFISDVEKPLSDMPLVRGRGIMSGDKQLWNGTPNTFTVVKRVCLEGIHIFEPHNHIVHGLGYFKDVAVVGAWHGNTDGIGRNVPVDDPYDGWHADECFCMAGDTNLALGGFGRVRNHTMWQLGNAEPLWIQGAKNCIADGIYIITFNKIKKSGEVINFALNKRNSYRNKVKVSNVIIDAPFINRVINVTSSPSTEDVVFEDVLFENVTVNTPYIKEKSLVGFIGDKTGNYGKVVFRNLVINGKRVSSENFGEYFEMLGGVSLGKDIFIE